MTALLSLLTGGNGLIAGLVAVLIAVGGAWLKGRSMGANSERSKQTEAKLRAAEDRLEMDREATEAEKEAGALSDAEARKEADRWARPQ
jgi:outer membrane murein-binding lipoprotein Lpp